MDDKKNSTKKKSSIVAQAEAKAAAMTREKQKAKKAKANGAKQPVGIVKYFKELRGEFKRVTWPSRKKVMHNTFVVLVGMSLTALFIWGVDSALAALIGLTGKL